MAVTRPRVARARLGTGKPEGFHSDDIGPRHGGEPRFGATRDDDVLTSIVAEAAQAIELLEIPGLGKSSGRGRRNNVGPRIRNPRACRSRNEWRVRPGELIDERSVRGVHHRACCRSKQELIFAWHQISAPEEDPSRLVDPRLLRAAFDKALQLVLEILKVACRVFVEDHEIELEPFEPKVLVRFEQVRHQRYAECVSEPHDQDR